MTGKTSKCHRINKHQIRQPSDRSNPPQHQLRSLWKMETCNHPLLLKNRNIQSNPRLAARRQRRHRRAMKLKQLAKQQRKASSRWRRWRARRVARHLSSRNDSGSRRIGKRRELPQSSNLRRAASRQKCQLSQRKLNRSSLHLRLLANSLICRQHHSQHRSSHRTKRKRRLRRRRVATLASHRSRSRNRSKPSTHTLFNRSRRWHSRPT